MTPQRMVSLDGELRESGPVSPVEGERPSTLSSVGINIWLAGAVAGLSVNLLVFPLDTIKTRLQSPSFQRTCWSATNASRSALWRNPYQGVGAVVLVAIPSSGVFFTTYEGLKYSLGGSLPQPALHAFSSSIAQLLNCAVIAPAEVLKQNAQMLSMHHTPLGAASLNKKGPSATMKVLRQLRRHPTKLWRGYTALAVRDLPFTALQFPAFEYLKEVLIARRSRLRKSGGPVMEVFERTWICALSAGVAGSAAAWITTPFDVVKTRMMLEVGGKDSFAAKRDFGKMLLDHGGQLRGQGRRSGFAVGKEVLRSEGVRGLFRGGLVRAAFTILGNGLYMGCYEGAKYHLQGH